MEEHLCIFCQFVKMRKDICGTYCSKGHENPNHDCAHYEEYRRNKRKNPQKET